MTKSKAIRCKCLECGGHSPKEVTLCPTVDCALWLFRFGYTYKDQRFQKRMDAAKRNYPNEYRRISQLLIEHMKNVAFLSENEQIRAFLKKNIIEE